MSEVTGKIKELGQTMTVGSTGTFRKRTLVVSSDEKYVQHIPIDFVQDKCEVLDNYKLGDSVKVSINIRGNEYNDKYYVSLNGWKIEKVTVQSPEQPQQSFAPESNVADEEEDTLPF